MTEPGSGRTMDESNLHQRHLTLAFIIMGCSAMMSQAVLLRELLLLFTGNELTLGLMLAVWLIWTAIGSGWGSRWIQQVRRPIRVFILSQLLLVFVLPATIVFIRLSRSIFAITVGEIASPIFIVGVPLLGLAPIGIIIGFLYTLACQILASREHQLSSVPGRVYLLEAIGSGLAGFVASVVLFRWFGNFQVAMLICLLNWLVAVMIWYPATQRYRIMGLVAALALAGGWGFFWLIIDGLSLQKNWGQFHLRHSQSSIYGQIAVTQLGEGISFYENGTLMFTHPELMSAEEAVHFALLQHPQPERVLLIGGNVAGDVPQVLQHPSVKQLDFVLLDPNAIRLAKMVFPEINELLRDARLTIWHEDGRSFVQRTGAQYDVVIVNLPEPQTALINRFFTLEFYQAVKRKMNHRGVLSFAVPAAENVLSQEQALLLRCLHRTLLQVFPDVVLIPGNSIHFIACLASHELSRDPEQLLQRLRERRLQTTYVREYYIPFRMSPDRMRYIAEQLQPTAQTPLNRDFRPIGYFYHSMLWLSFFHRQFADKLAFVRHLWWLGLAGGLLLLGGLMVRLMTSARNQQTIRPGILLAILAIGFTGISLEVLIILGFQAIYGYAYYQLALIISGYMIGLAGGSWCGLQAIERQRGTFSLFIQLQMAFICYPLLTYGGLLWLSEAALAAVWIQLVFLALILGAGFIAGVQFPLASHLLFRQPEKIARIGGALYAWDLLGAVAGALFTSTLLVPLLGLVATCLIIAGINLFVITILVALKLTARKESNPLRNLS